MTKDDILRMAREADREWDCDREMVEWLECFSELVAKAERDGCAKDCEKLMSSFSSKKYTTDPLGGFKEQFATKLCIEKILERGQP